MTSNWKGILMAGGAGTRLAPVTLPFSKHLLPVYDKPMIFYSLAILMHAGIRDVMIICTDQDSTHYEVLLGDGKDLGLDISYKIQKEPDGIATAFILAADFIGNANVCLMLGDNIFYGQGLPSLLHKGMEVCRGGVVYAYPVADPERFGVIELDDHGRPSNIEEKPLHPQSNLALTGLYFYNNDVIKRAANLPFSLRGEREITDINIEYLNEKKLDVIILGRGIAWLDTGTHDSLLEASQFVKTIEERQGYKIGCLEEIAFRAGWISVDCLLEKAATLSKTKYGQYLKRLPESRA